MTQFKRIEITEEVLEQIGRGNMCSISYQVTGFWSTSVLSIYIRPGTFGDESKFVFEISDSSGGRDTKVVEHDSIAYQHKAAAMIDACATISSLELQMTKLLAYDQLMREEMRKKHAEEREAHRLLLEADPVTTEARAKMIVKLARKSETVVEVPVRIPGGNSPSYKLLFNGRGIFKNGHEKMGVRETESFIATKMSDACAKEVLLTLI